MISGLKELGLEADQRQLDQFQRFMALMLEWNEKINLTAITDPEEVVTKHFIDSLVPMKFKEKYDLDMSYSLDMGTGGGFPGIPLKIMQPEMKSVLADSLNKRISYLDEAVVDLGLKNVTPLHARAEELGQDLAYREQFSIVFSRAVAAMNILVEYCLPFVKVGGYFVALKGSGFDEELDVAEKAIRTLGGDIVGIENLELPLIHVPRTLVFVKKVKPTPKKYPRRPGKPKRNPL